MKIKVKRCAAVLLGSILSIPLLMLIGSFIPRQWHQTQTGGSYPVCALQFDIHTNIVLPVQTDAFDWRKQFPLPLDRAQYVGFGWGERVWYMNPPSRPLEVMTKGLRAMVFQNRAVLQVHRYERFPTDHRIKCVGVERSRYLALVNFIQQSFQRDSQGRLIRLENPASENPFYEATGRYSLLHNSNHWTAEGLRQAGLNTPLWAGFSFAILHHLK